MQIQYIIGWLAVLASAFFFYMATVVIRWAQASVSIDPAFFTFGRFALGFIIVSLSMAFQRRSLRANRYRYLIGFAVFNTLAVFTFYKAVEVTTVANANILNMTYPIFVAIIAWLFLREQRDVIAMTMVPVAFAGIWLLVDPSGLEWDLSNGWGLASGVISSFAVVLLNICRKHDSAETTLFYVFGLNSLLALSLFYEQIHMPNSKELYFLLICSLCGVGGQYLLTYGFRYVTAIEGSIINSTRIILAALLGPLLVSDPALTMPGWIGAILIFAANVVLAARKVNSQNRTP